MQECCDQKFSQTRIKERRILKLEDFHIRTYETEAETGCNHIILNFEWQAGCSSNIVEQKEVVAVYDYI